MKLFTFELPACHAPTLFESFRCEPYSLFLDSADQKHPGGRFSFIAFQPFETITAKDGKIIISGVQGHAPRSNNPFKAVKDRLLAWKVDPGAPEPDLPPFRGGAAGFFGYDLARGLENLPSHTAGNSIPDMAIGLYDKVIAFDHKKDKAWAFITSSREVDAEKTFRGFLQRIENRPYPLSQPDFSDPEWRSADAPETYKNKIRRTIEYIHAGDIFQANLSQCFEAVLPDGFDPFVHYLRLREMNPAPFAGYMNFGDFILSSASPERFLSVRSRRVEARPIKGTRPRLSDKGKDEEMKRELIESIKDRSENIMIVDLLRNDLSKSCTDESVDVPELCRLETFAGVHHLVSTITGTLREKQHALDLLESCFPGGSITGAPKVRAMEIIDELETHRRGPYCGAMGYIGFDGVMDMNIAIRTLVYMDRAVSFNVGGGIVAESDPASEYQETLDKAEKIFKSFSSGAKKRKIA